MRLPAGCSDVAEASRGLGAQGFTVARLTAALCIIAVSGVSVSTASAQSEPPRIVLAQAPLGYAAPGPSPADFFSALFGLRPQRRFVEPPRASAPAGESRAKAPPTSAAPAASGVAIAYCVRTCDGGYFPLQGRPSGAGEKAAAEQCTAFCPAAKTQVFTSPDRDKGIDAAIDRNGRAYADSPNAYVYRSRLVAGCTCTGTPGGLARIPPARDPTLQRGDAVMTADGMRIFTGGQKGPPFRQADFVTPKRFPELSREMRRRLDELTVAAAQ